MVEKVRQKRAELMLLGKSGRVAIDQHPVEILEDQVGAPAGDQRIDPVAQGGEFTEIGTHRLVQQGCRHQPIVGCCQALEMAAAAEALKPPGIVCRLTAQPCQDRSELVTGVSGERRWRKRTQRGIELPVRPAVVVRHQPDVSKRVHAAMPQRSRLSAGNSMTSRILGLSVSSMTSLSMPMPHPPVGGIPYSSART